jgi:hypothetical protein
VLGDRPVTRPRAALPVVAIPGPGHPGMPTEHSRWCTPVSKEMARTAARDGPEASGITMQESGRSRGRNARFRRDTLAEEAQMS